MINPQKIFKDQLKGTLGRKLFASPGTYRLARDVFVKNNRFDFEARRKLTAMSLDQAAEAYQGDKPVAWTSAFSQGNWFIYSTWFPLPPRLLPEWRHQWRSLPTC